MLRVSAELSRLLDASGARIALVSRSGLDLRRFGLRYSHMGIALKASAGGPWAVRQLYYACDERRPLIFDQGLPAFVMGTENPALGFLSVLVLRGREADALEAAALDDRTALSLLAPTYRANAFAFATAAQNCNQWVVELMALAWGERSNGADTAALRADGQRWLQAAGYVPASFELGFGPLTHLARFSPFLGRDDHPPADLAAGRFRVSMPEAIEAFVMRRLGGDAQRLELCHDTSRVGLHQGAAPGFDGDRCGPAEAPRAAPAIGGDG